MTEVWHWMGLAPLAVVFVRRAEWQYRMIAAAFAVSFVADSFRHFGVDPLLIATVYPVSQAGLMALALLPMRDALLVFVALVSAGIATAGLYDQGMPDVLLTTVAFLTVFWLSVQKIRPGLLHASLIVYYGLGVVAWWAFAWTAYTSRAQDAMTVYQVTRFAGLALFCLAVVRPAPRLKVA